jgi:predicted DNA-binding transcriptional regulator AlpA
MASKPKLADRLSYAPRLLDAERSAAYVSVGRTKFLEMVGKGVMPKPMDLDGMPRWDRHELDGAINDLKDRRHDPKARARAHLDELLEANDGQG